MSFRKYQVAAPGCASTATRAWTGAERIYDGYPDVALEMLDHRTFDGRTQLVAYRPRVLDHPPLAAIP